MNIKRETTTAWVVFPEYTQWENKDNQLFWDKDLELEDAANAAVKFSWKKPVVSRKWERPVTFGDFVLVSNSNSSEWLKMVRHKDDSSGYEWQVSSWEEVFGEESAVRKDVKEYLEDATKVNDALTEFEEQQCTTEK